MKSLFNINRIYFTFALYLVIIIIPLGIVYYVGTVSLEDKRRQIENNVQAELANTGDSLKHELFTVWEAFLREELFRKYYHYQAVTLPESAEDEEYLKVEGLRPERSPLAHTIDRLDNLGNDKGGYVNPSRPSMNDAIRNSVVGYFSFEPATNRLFTPYDASPYLHLPASTERLKRTLMVNNFRHFLEQDLHDRLLDELGLRAGEEVVPNNVLRFLRVNNISKEKEYQAKVECLDRLAANLPLTRTTMVGSPTIWVYYYDFRFCTYSWKDTNYVIGFRPVLVNKNRLLVQGFVVNTLVLIQELQSYLEEIQPEFGSVVIEDSTPVLGEPLFDPFNFLVITYKANGDKNYLHNYHDERRRFNLTMIVLTIALVFSMVHLGSLILGHVDLHRKKNNFISAITHELKAPLTSIMMYAEMLEEGWARGKEVTYYQHIRWESERLSRLIRNILDFSGLERGTFKLQRAPLELDIFVEETLAALADWIDKSGLKLDIHIEAQPLVLVDKDSMSQVIYNLCDNTIKYGLSNEQPLLTVRVAELEEKAILEVFDNGAGIPKEEESKIFNRFYRIENEMTRESTGTGLGLALVKDLVEGNQGTIAYFRPANGSGFGVRITFPKLDEPEDDFDDGEFD